MRSITQLKFLLYDYVGALAYPFEYFSWYWGVKSRFYGKIAKFGVRGRPRGTKSFLTKNGVNQCLKWTQYRNNRWLLPYIKFHIFLTLFPKDRRVVIVNFHLVIRNKVFLIIMRRFQAEHIVVHLTLQGSTFVHFLANWRDRLHVSSPLSYDRSSNRPNKHTLDSVDMSY